MLDAAVPAVAIVFVAFAVILVAAAVRDSLQAENRLTPSRRIWLRMAFIFSVVAIGLFVWHTFLM